ncbi:hypothetical protein PULV_a2308 [Pseudoalteromonas ulvae UL12]|uniref:tetratricopeptide repeat protein n=1 Tax=Pseudoalteromonas ulvae TaxID=107327 RepID=UPI00186B7FE1|nr:hypothetical protein [Pseudoalteromonas ulvae]MBE0364585.1 hypothetical protein [Pseudoalteromonas ulvae UL12]
MRYYSLLVCLLVSLLALPNITIAGASSPTTAPNVSATHTTSTVNSTQTHPDWQYQQLFAMQNQLARLDEKLKQQTALGNDVKALETTQQTLKVQLANLQTKLEAQERVQTNQLNGFDGRIGDLKDMMNWWFSALTIFLALGGYIVYRKSKKEAGDVAGKQMETFIAENADQILEKAKSSLESKVDELNLVVNGLQKYLSEAREIIEDKKKEVEAAADNVLKAIAAKQEIDPDDLRVLENSTKRIDKEHATAREYLSLANVSYGKKDYQTALKWLDLAIGALRENELQTLLNAQLLWSKAMAYMKLMDEVAELNSYDMLIAQFKTSQNEAIQIYVANAIFNQGFRNSKQGNIKSALNTYAELIKQFKRSPNAAIQQQVAKAMVNQGVAYGLLGKPDAELNSYSILIEQFKDSSNEEIQIAVAKAMYNQSVVHGRQKDFSAALNTHTELLVRFKGVSNVEIEACVNNTLVYMAELALLFETPEQVLVRIAEVENMSEDSQVFAVMQFIRFLLGDNTIDDVLTAIAAIPKEMELTWQFDEIKDYLAANFTGEKQQQIQAVVAFFEQHKDIETLRNALGIQR